MANPLKINGVKIQYDASGVGACWRPACEATCPAQVRMEIECEIIDGGHDHHDGYRASNGVVYRW